MNNAFRSFCCLIALLCTSACTQAENKLNVVQAQTQTNCQLDNPSLQAMPMVDVSFTRADGSVLKTRAKLANNNITRSAGFQHVCASTIAATPILFSFNMEAQPSFHMNNVVAPIDIAFIDKKGRIESVQSMQPYSLLMTKKPLYRPNRPVIAAFEAHPGFFEIHAISLESQFSWAKPEGLLSPK